MNTPPPSPIARVLIVEDHPQVAELLEAYLADMPDVSTLIARNGEQALARVRDSHPDLILLDIMMPRMSGFEACRILKEDPQTRDIPIIVVTALNTDTDYERAYEAGADDYLRKPVNRVELRMRIQSLLELRRLRRQLRSSPLHEGPQPDRRQPP
jgi:two-component system cell cycle response regulator